MKFFQKTSVAVIFTVLMIAAALFIGLSPVLKSDKPAEAAQTAVPEQTISQTNVINLSPSFQSVKKRA